MNVLSPTLLAALVVVAPACKGKSSDGPEPKPDTSAAAGEPSRRAALDLYRPLLDEAGRAELDAGGLVIDFGRTDQHKYTRGGWRSGWGALTADDDTYAALESRRGYLDLLAPSAPPTAIVVRARARSAAGQQLTWFVDATEVGTMDLGEQWAIARIPLPQGSFPSRGPVRLEARASRAAVGGVRAEIDWVWLAAGAGESPLEPRVMPLEIEGTTRRALAAPGARTYAFYLEPTAEAHLVADLGASGTADFIVTATTDDGGRVELLRETVARGWRERAVPLGQLAGRAVRLELTTANQQGAAGWGEPELAVERATSPAAPAISAGGPPPRNVIVLVMDTARADAFGPFAGSDRVVRTPAFDALAAKSTVFAHAYNNENWTKPSVATTLSGLYPSTHNTKEDASKLSDDVELLGERLERDGFATAAFVANGYVSKTFGFGQGWGEFRNYIRENRPSEAEHVFGDALAWHAEHTRAHPEQRYFLYLQTIDPHVSYSVDKAYWAPYFDGTYDGALGSSIDAADQVKLSTNKLVATDRDKAWLRALYFGEIAYHDAQLARFLETLEARGGLADTMLVITNDHGEELGERGRYGHGHQVFEEMIRAPLIIHYPPLFRPGAVVDEVVEHVDLAPTIVDVLGRPPLAAADGVSLLPMLRGQPSSLPPYAITEFLHGRRVVRVGPWKLVATGRGATLFDVANDPAEAHDLAASAPITRRLCEVHLAEALAMPNKAKRMDSISPRQQFRAGEANITGSMRRQLEALGYLGSSSPSGGGDEDGDEK